MRDIPSRIERHFNVLREKYGDRLMFVTAIGSMNYGTFCEESDVDTLALILPTFEELVLKQPESMVINIDDEQCSVKDLRVYINELKKQNICRLETLVTKYYMTNVKYEEDYRWLQGMAEDICHYDEYRFGQSTRGMVHEFAKQWYKSYEQWIVSSDDSVLNYKAAYNVVRLCETMERYIRGLSFDKVIHCDDALDRGLLLRIKHGEIGTEELNRLVRACECKLPQIEERTEVNIQTEERLKELVLGIFAEKVNFYLTFDESCDRI